MSYTHTHTHIVFPFKHLQPMPYLSYPLQFFLQLTGLATSPPKRGSWVCLWPPQGFEYPGLRGGPPKWMVNISWFQTLWTNGWFRGYHYFWKHPHKHVKKSSESTVSNVMAGPAFQKFNRPFWESVFENDLWLQLDYNKSKYSKQQLLPGPVWPPLFLALGKRLVVRKSTWNATCYTHKN